jgi:hypothetical protein
VVRKPGRIEHPGDRARGGARRENDTYPEPAGDGEASVQRQSDADEACLIEVCIPRKIISIPDDQPLRATGSVHFIRIHEQCEACFHESLVSTSKLEPFRYRIVETPFRIPKRPSPTDGDLGALMSATNFMKLVLKLYQDLVNMQLLADHGPPGLA